MRKFRGHFGTLKRRLPTVLVVFLIPIIVIIQLINRNTGDVGAITRSGTDSYVASVSSKFMNVLENIPGFKIESESLANEARRLYEKMMFDTDYTWFDRYTLRENLLKISVGAEKGKSVDSYKDLDFYENDPRLVWSVYLDHLKNLGGSSNELEIPFSWYDFADFHELNKLISITNTTLQCQFLLDSAFEKETLLKVENELNEKLFTFDRHKYEHNEWYKKARSGVDSRVFSEKNMHRYCKMIDKNDKLTRKNGKPKFRLPFNNYKNHDRVKPEVFQLQARNILLTTSPNPLSLTLLNKDSSAFRIDIKQDTNENIIESGLLTQYFERNNPDVLITENDLNGNDAFGFDEPIDHEFDMNNHYHNFLESKDSEKFKINIEGATYGAFDKPVHHLQKSDFSFDSLEMIKTLENQAKEKPLNKHDQKYLESLLYSIKTHPALISKYFHEPSRIQQFAGLGLHRDGRFFNGAVIDDPLVYSQKLNSMIRVFQKFTKANGLTSWLAHGTLYGYLYNAETFPWDNDFDLQMPIKHLHLLSRHFNQTLVVEDPREGNGKYFIDVTDSITTRTRGNKRCNIDARFVDIDSGLYIDITGLSVSSAPAKHTVQKIIEEKLPEIDIKNTTIINFEKGLGLAAMNTTELKQYVRTHMSEFSPDKRNKINDQVVLEEKFRKGKSVENSFTPDERYKIHYLLGFYNCRNEHFVDFDRISPLISTVFHGVPTFVPKKYGEILKDEYIVPSENKLITYKKYTFLPELRRWIITGYLNKCANQYNWYPKQISLNSPLTDMGLSDVKAIYYNFLKSGYYSSIATFYDTYDANAYRSKEVEIIYDSELDIKTKQKLLHELKWEVLPNLKSPYKDPFLYRYENNLWKQMKKSLSSDSIDEIVKMANLNAVSKLIKKTDQLYNRRLPLFNTNTTETLHDKGLNIFKGQSKVRLFDITPDLE